MQANKATNKLDLLSQAQSQAIPNQPIAEKPVTPLDVEGKGYIYQGRRPGKEGESILNPLGDSNDSKNLANRYKSKLQSQSNQIQAGPAFTSDTDFEVRNNAPSGGGGYGGGMGGMAGGAGAGMSGGMGMGSGGERGMPGGGLGTDLRNNFGVLPPSFGAPVAEKQAGEKQNQDRKSYEDLAKRIESTISPDQWQSAGGTSSMRDFRQNLSLVVTAPQETTTDQAYMASLAITLPVRGKEFFFTTPRGEVVLSANGISKTITQRAIGLVMLAIAIALMTATKARRAS